MTEDKLTWLMGLHSDAVELPWCRTDTGEIVENDPDGEYIIAEAVRVADADLIVEAVNALPGLVAEVRRLRHNIEGALNWADHAIKYADTLTKTDLHLPVKTCSLAGAHHAAGAAVRALLTDGDEVTP
ncbi:MAG: hypothetical protein GY772_21745 [bacterium]|nr:hypothetical protein [bacterium]